MKRTAALALIAAFLLAAPHAHATQDVLRTAGAFLASLLTVFAFAMGLPLFSRIRRSDVLDHAQRRRIMDVVRTSPGLGLLDLQRRLGCGWGTTVHHVERLCRAGLLVSEDAGRRRALFLPDHDRSQRQAATLVRTPRQRGLLEYVARNPGCSQREAAAAAGISAPLAHRYLRRVESSGLIVSQKTWRTRTYAPKPELLAQLAHVTPGPLATTGAMPASPLPRGAALSPPGTSAR